MSETIDLDQVKKWHKLNENYSINYKDKLGKGAYGTVYKGYSKERNSLIAIKVVKTNILSKRQIQTLKSLSSLNHPSIMGFYGELNIKDETYLFLQYCSKGCLADLIKQNKQAKQQTDILSQLDILRMFREMVEGMCYMNAKQKMHRDFKPQNILIGSPLEIKICDFGLSQTTDSIFVTARMGTPLYAAPEVFLIQNSGQEGYSWNCDVWSAGFILYEMLMKQNLFKNVTDYKQLKQEWMAFERGFKQAKISQKFHPLWNYFVNYMIQFDAKKRPTFHSVLQKLKMVYDKMQHSIKTKSNMIQDLNLQQANLFINYNISKYQILIDVCQKFTQQNFRIENQFKYACMFMCLLRYNQFVIKFIRDLKYRSINFQGQSLLNNVDEAEVQMFCDRFRFILQHRQVFYRKQLRQSITVKIQNDYCKRDKSKELMKELSLVVNLTNRYSKNQAFQNSDEIYRVYKSILAPLKRIRDYKKFNQSQLRMYCLVLISMLLEEKFPSKEYRRDVQKQLARIRQMSKQNLLQLIQKMYVDICK